MNDIANDVEQFLLKGDWKKEINMGGEAEYVNPDGDLQVIVTAQSVWRLGRFTDSDIDGVATGLFETIAEGKALICLLDAITAATENLTCGTCDCRILPGESWETFGDAPYHENPDDCAAAIREQRRIELSELQAQRNELIGLLGELMRSVNQGNYAEALSACERAATAMLHMKVIPIYSATSHDRAGSLRRKNGSLAKATKY